MSRVVVVTGAASGIGLAVAQRLDEDGWTCVLSDRSEGRLTEVTSALSGAEAVPGDLRDQAVVDQIAESAAAAGGASGAVLCAGVARPAALEATTSEMFDEIFDVNVRAPFFLLKALQSGLLANRGSVVLIGSMASLVGQRGSPAYVASKGAVLQLTRALALDWAEVGVRVNAVCPGIVDTPMTASYVREAGLPGSQGQIAAKMQPLGRLATPSECADAVRFLLSSEASFITGVGLPVDGGLTAQ